MRLTGQALADYATGKKGTPYFYGTKMETLTEDFMARMHKSYPNTVTENYMRKARSKGMVGKVCTDCSGLISAYTGKVLGSSQLYQQAYTRLAISTYKSWANGVVVWRSGHVGVFFKKNGSFYVAEAKGIDYGTVISAFNPGKWSYGLTFSWLDYSYTENVVNKATWKGTNPYPVPMVMVCQGSKGDAVKWVQWELMEAGYTIDIDGDCGTKTDEAIRAFQASCKIAVDGKVGPDTRKYLMENVQGEAAPISNAAEEKGSAAAPEPVLSPAPTPETTPVAPVYSREDFIGEIQQLTGAKVDRVAGSETLSKTVTISKNKNNKHILVWPLQKYFNALGYDCGEPDGIAGTKFDSAVKEYQKNHGCVVDGELTAKKGTWKSLLGLN